METDTEIGMGWDGMDWVGLGGKGGVVSFLFYMAWMGRDSMG